MELVYSGNFESLVVVEETLNYVVAELDNTIKTLYQLDLGWAFSGTKELLEWFENCIRKEIDNDAFVKMEIDAFKQSKFFKDTEKYFK